MSGDESRPGLMTRLQPENWSVPVKLGAVLLVPILLALVLGGLRIADQIHNATGLAALGRYTDLQTTVSRLVTQLQQERNSATVAVATPNGGAAPNDGAPAVQDVFGQTDSAESATQSAVGDAGALGGAPAAAYQRVQQSLAGLGQLRTQVTSAGAATPPADPDADKPGKPASPKGDVDAQVSTISAGYTSIIDSLITFEVSLDRQLDDPSLSPLASGLAALGAVQEQLALQHTIVAAAIAKGVVRQPEVDAVHTADARLGSATDQFRAGLTSGQQQQYGSFVNGPQVTRFTQLKQTALAHVGARGQVGVSAQDWDGAYTALDSDVGNAVTGLTGEIAAASKSAQAASRNQAGVDSVILLLATLAAAAVVYLVGRSLLRPLRILRTTALEVAGERLPKALQAMRDGKIPDASVEPVPVNSLEEIGQVARAFDEVHGQAVKLAAEQATLQTSVSNMFVNLSRRSQTLVERQLQLIERLERNEQDSEQLANLFQLDHLATRMRRNSENLLVLAGSELGKRGGAQVPVVDVLRAAVSEIEQYQRVVLQPPPPVEIVGRAANDLVHLVAELLDNATSYSAPDTQVVVSSTRTTDGSLLVEIADQGVGMPAEELAGFNARLAGRSEMDVSASRRMGLFVVGRLAARHGIGVRLASSDASRGASVGVTVAVNVPTRLVTLRADRTDRKSPERTGGVSRAEIEGAAVAGTTGLVAGPRGGARNGAPTRRPGGVNGSGALPRRPAGPLPQRATGASVPPPGRPGSRPNGPGGPGRPGQPPMPPGALPRRPGRPPATSGAPQADGLPPAPNGVPQADGLPPAAPVPNGAPPAPPATGPAVNGTPPVTGAPRGNAAPPANAAPSTTGAAPANGGSSTNGVNAAPPVNGESRTTGPPARPSGPVPPSALAPGRSRELPDRSSPSQRLRADAPDHTETAGPRGRTAPPAPEPEALWEANTPSAEENLGRSSGRPAGPSEESPIFEETSAWFRDSRQPLPGGRPAPEPPPAPVGREPDTFAAASAERRPDDSPVGWPAAEAEHPEAETGPEWTEPEQQLLRPMPDAAAGEFTSAGLPKRRPRAQLIPGSPPPAAAPATGAGSRSAEQVRGRLASYQSGVRQGRESRLRRMAEANTNGTADAVNGTNGKENA